MDSPATPEEERRNRALRAINAHIGRRARERRTLRDLSLEQVGQLIGMSYQQVQKYESGDSAIAAARMVHLALALRADPADFLAGLPAPAYVDLGFVPPKGVAAPGGVRVAAEEQRPLAPPSAAAGDGAVPLAELETLRDAFLAIRDEAKRQLLLEMAQALAR
jgi:transcriptional regulator with XRE-family HTH domain